MAKKSKAETATFWVGLFALLTAIVTLTDNHFDKIVSLFGAEPQVVEEALAVEEAAGEQHTPEMLEQHTPEMLEQHTVPPEQHTMQSAPPEKAAVWPWIVLVSAIVVNITWFVIRSHRRRHETTVLNEVA